MKKLTLIALAIIGLTSCDKAVKVTNSIESNNEVGKIALVDITVKYYHEGRMAGEVYIDSVASGETSKRVKIPQYSDYVKIVGSMSAQDTTVKAKLFQLVYGDTEMEFEPNYFTKELTTEIEICGRTNYRKTKK